MKIKLKNFLMIALLMAQTSAHADLIVHEWGTFTSLMGSNGKIYDGMFHEDEILPDFVHRFGEVVKTPPAPKPFPIPTPPPRRPGCGGHSKVGCEFLENQIITQKMETPVLYFYSDKELNAQVHVDFPGGIISEAYPKWSRIRPVETPGVKLINGSVDFNVEVLAPNDQSFSPPYVESENIYSHARLTKSNLIKSGNEVEKFIFYRGLGAFNTVINITSKNGNLDLVNKSQESIKSIYLFDIDENGGSFIKLNSLTFGQKQTVGAKTIEQLKLSHDQFDTFIQNAENKLLQDLLASGLYVDEAVAMINTWKQGYFKTPGLRVLYVLNRSEVESILPLSLNVKATALNRVFIGRIEVMTDQNENELLTTILEAHDLFDIKTLGRFADSIINRLQDVLTEKKLNTKENISILENLKKQL